MTIVARPQGLTSRLTNHLTAVRNSAALCLFLAQDGGLADSSLRHAVPLRRTYGPSKAACARVVPAAGARASAPTHNDDHTRGSLSQLWSPQLADQTLERSARRVSCETAPGVMTVAVL